MAILDILEFPERRLRAKAKPVTVFDGALERLIEDLAETMYSARGVGLAAIQVGVRLRVVVLDISASRNELVTLVNPTITDVSGSQETQEGCLSLPDIYESVSRAEHISLTSLNTRGEMQTMEADGMLAVCIQHEVDHLVGKLFIDYLSRMKRDRIRKRGEKRRRLGDDQRP